MTNKKKIAEMMRRKEELEAKIAALREGKAFRNSLAFLIESTLDKTEVVLAAKAIVEKLSKMAEDLAKVSGDDVMPLMDALKEAFGPQMAESFQKNTSAQINAITEAMVKAKDAISTEVGKLEGVVNGDDVTDMGSFGDDTAPTDPLAGEDPLAAAAAPAPAPDAAAPPAPAPAEEDADLDDIFGDVPNDGAAGRARKESAQPKRRPMKEGRRLGKPLSEGILDSVKSFVRPHAAKVALTGSAREKLESLKAYITAEDYEFLAQCPDPLLATVFDEAGAAPAPVAPAGPIATPPVSTTLPVPVGPAMGDVSLPGDDLGGDLDPDFDVNVSGDLDADLAGSFEDDLDDPMLDTFESAPAKRLRESRDPDAMIVRAFRVGLREGASPVNVARAVSRAFGIDLADVIEIVKEAAPVPPMQPNAPNVPATSGSAAPAKPANPADQAKALTLATKIKAQNPAGVKDDEVAGDVQRNITSVGKTSREAPGMTDLVKGELGKMGAVKEQDGEGTDLPVRGTMPQPMTNTLFSKPVSEGSKDNKWAKRGKLLKPKPVTMPSKKK